MSATIAPQHIDTSAVAPTTVLPENLAQPEATAPSAVAHPAPTAQPGDSDADRGFAIASFVLGICSVVAGWTFFAPIVGLVLGILALRRRTTERTLALWGVVLNSVMLAFALALVLLFVGLMFFGLIAAPAFSIF